MMSSQLQLGKPGTPTATQVDGDSITITWKAPTSDQDQVSSYKIVYWSAAEPELKYGEDFGLRMFCAESLLPCTEYYFKVQAISTSGVPTDSDVICAKTEGYYDIVVVGKTGQGKSTLGNKLLNLAGTNPEKIRCFDDTTVLKRFTQADEEQSPEQVLSVTIRCKLLSNEDTSVRVLDVPGFSDTGKAISGPRIPVHDANLQIIRWVVRAQIQSQLNVRRLVYFLPIRGPLENADGRLQEELKVLYHYFDKEVFDCMVVVATNPPKQRFQDLGFDQNDIEETKKVFKAALMLACGEDIACPPIIYSGFNDSPAVSLSKVLSAPVLKEQILPLRFSDNICADCSVKIRCSHENEKIAVVYTNGASVPYFESKCHPSFVQKYTGAAKFFGGLLHASTLGVSLLFKNSWPGFTNAEKVCAACKQPPGAVGCGLVGSTVIVNKKSVEVDHSSKV